MPSKAPTPCSICSTLGPCEHRGAPRRYRASRAWTEQSRALIAAHVAEHGWTCPGWGDDHQPHPETDLTTHHVQSLATHGPDGELVVLCRSMNSALGS